MMGSPPVFIWSFTNCNKRAPRQCSGHCIWSYLKNTLVNKWLHQPPQIRSNKTCYIYSAAELRAICGSLLTDYLQADPNALEMGNCLFSRNPTVFCSAFHPPGSYSERGKETLWWVRRAEPLVCTDLWADIPEAGSCKGGSLEMGLPETVMCWPRTDCIKFLIFDSFIEQ